MSLDVLKLINSPRIVVLPLPAFISIKSRFKVPVPLASESASILIFPPEVVISRCMEEEPVVVNPLDAIKLISPPAVEAISSLTEISPP